MNLQSASKLQSICVFCGSADGLAPEYLEAARQTGGTIAGRGQRLIYGGGKTGLMGAVAEAALSAGGEVIGIIIPSMNTPELAHSALSHLEVAPDMHARKGRMHQLADAYVALPGGFGTLDELFEAITWAQIGAHEKPIGVLNVRDYYAPMLAALDHSVQEGFIFREHRAALYCETDPQALLDAMARHKPPREAVRRWLRQHDPD